MRKLLAIIVILLVLVVTAPWVTGVWFEHDYKQGIASYNSEGNVSIQLQRYHRRWFDSDAILTVQTSYPDTQNLAFTITQHIQHGPVLYGRPFPIFLGLASIHNSIQPWEFSYPENGMIFHFSEGVNADINLLLSQKRMMGHITVPTMIVEDARNRLSATNIAIQFDQSQSASGLWMGSMQFLLSEFRWHDSDNNDLSIEGVQLNGKLQESAGKVTGFRSFQVNQVTFNNDTVGPLSVQMSVVGLNAQAIGELIAAYRKIAHEGELYKSQLQQKLSSILPGVVDQNTRIKLDSLSFSTPEGHLKMNGEVSWPDAKNSSATNMIDLLQEANVKANVQVNKLLVDRFINFISRLPYFRSISPERRKELVDLNMNLEMASQRNVLLMLTLVQYHLLSEDIAFQFLDLQKNDAPLENYAFKIKELLLHRQITLPISYLLFWYYLDVAHQTTILQQALQADQGVVAQQMRDQVDAWEKAGYILPKQDDYILQLQKNSESVKMNGKEI